MGSFLQSMFLERKLGQMPSCGQINLVEILFNIEALLEFRRDH